MSKKRREDQRKREPLQLKPFHYVIGAAVLLGSVAIGIGVFTLLGGASLSEGEREPARLPDLGPTLAAEPSAASEILDKKVWDEMTVEEQALVQTEVTRVYSNATFRASGALAIGVDIFIRDGQTLVSRQFYELKDPVGSERFAEFLAFYCNNEEYPPVTRYRYEKVPGAETELKRADMDERAQPFEISVSGVNWDQGVTDLGFKDIDGRRAHGLRLVYNSNNPEIEGNRKEADYWFDVENARLLERQDVLPGRDSTRSRYRLEWKQLPPLELPEGAEQPACVPDTFAAVNASI